MTVAPRSIFITGGAGYLGGEVTRQLAAEPERYRVTVFDLRIPPSDQRHAGVEYLTGDVRDPRIVEHLRARQVDAVVHLASIVNPGGPARREWERSIDVGGTENLLQAAVATGVRQFVVTSSGAAYGYHADNPIPLHEDDPLRGNPEFAYADHKRQVEELLARYRAEHPALRQLVFRPGTILGAGTDNQITRLFEGRMIVGVRGYETPFVFVWDQDVARCIRLGLEREASGVYNLAGDGVLTLRDLARRTGKPYVALSPALFRAVLWLAQRLGLSPHGPEQLLFLQYRPVLAGDRVQADFDRPLQKSTSETFDYFWAARESRT